MTLCFRAKAIHITNFVLILFTCLCLWHLQQKQKIEQVPFSQAIFTSPRKSLPTSGRGVPCSTAPSHFLFAKEIIIRQGLFLLNLVVILRHWSTEYLCQIYTSCMGILMMPEKVCNFSILLPAGRMVIKEFLFFSLGRWCHPLGRAERQSRRTPSRYASTRRRIYDTRSNSRDNENRPPQTFLCCRSYNERPWATSHTCHVSRTSETKRRNDRPTSKE